MSRHVPDFISLLRLLARSGKVGPGATYALAIPISRLIQLPAWVLVLCLLLAFAYGVLRTVIPQKSAHRLAWWSRVLDREIRHEDHDADHTKNRQ